jgi:TonB-dependent starch-binding outer membrane protein SusC
MKITLLEPLCSAKRQRLRKLIRLVMRVSLFYMILTVSSMQFLLAHDSMSQGIENIFVTIEMKNESLRVLFKKIEKQTTVRFTYFDTEILDYPDINLDKAQRSVKEVLDEVLGKESSLSYTQVGDHYIVIRKKNDLGEELPKEAELKSNSENLSSYTVTGIVTDASTQQPMAGVNVIVKNTTRGTTTDTEGKFSIDAEDGDVLVFSFIGFKTFETQVSGRTVINVPMAGDITALNEIVVNAGYWNVKDRERTGNISRVTADEIGRQPVSNPLAALQGRAAGLEITQTTGVPGGNFKVRIRGTNSIANGNDPLYIVNGVPYISSSMAFAETSIGILGNPHPAAGQGSSPLNSINPSDIESIEVLKDADATAIYGSRGANGVILITTKKGSSGKTNVDFNFYSGAARVGNKMDLLNRQAYLQMRREAFKNDNTTPTASNARDLLVWDTTRSTDWQKELIGGTAHINDAQVSISGGNDHTQFSIGGGFHKETTVFPGSNGDRRISSHVNITNTSPNQRLKTTFSLIYAINDTDLLSQDLANRALQLPPNAPALYDDQGNLNWAGWTSSYENPMAFLKRKYEANTTNFISNAVVGYAILPNLELKTSLGYTNTALRSLTIVPSSSRAPTSTLGNESYFGNSNFKNWIAEPQVSWRPRLYEGQFDILIGTTFLEQVSDGLAHYASGFSSEALMKNIASATTQVSGTNYYSQYRYHAVFGRVNYSLRERYIVNITGRRDGSSRFGPGKRFAIFGAIGSAWIFSKEDFIKDALPFLSFGKLRASYGTTGNDQLGDYQYLDTYVSSDGPYQGGVIGLSPTRLNNPNFAWETNKKFETGLELGFLADRILSSVSYFRNRSSNQLVGFPLAPTTGFESIQGNFPATVQNTGVEIELTTRNVETLDFSWSSSINLTIPRNELVDFPNLESFAAYANLYVVGESLNIRKLYHYTGMDPTTGLYQFLDLDENGALNVSDRQTVKFVGQDFYGGVQNSFRYKGFQLDILFQFVKQIGNNYMQLFSTPGFLSNQPDFVLNRWRAENDVSDIQRFGVASVASSAYTNFMRSDRSSDDASFIRLKNLSLSYVLPKRLIEKVKLENARIFCQGQNLLTITNYSGLDPEVQSRSLPPLKTLTAGIHLTF